MAPSGRHGPHPSCAGVVSLTLPGLVPTDLGEEDQRQHQDAYLPGPAAAWALRDPPAVSGLTFYALTLPLTLFLEWFLFLFCFLLNRKFLTYRD